MVRPSWRIASASEIGTSHIGSGTPCQDSAAQEVIETAEGPVLAAVVCDGAGSAAHSEVGSQLASASIIECVREHFGMGGLLADIDRDLMVGWILRAADQLIEQANEQGHNPKDYACTMLAVVAGEEGAVFAQIGDGAIVVSRGEEDGWLWVFWPQHGEYANQTVFILSVNATDSLEFGYEPHRIDEIAVFSDGIERMVLHAETKSVNDAFFNQMFAPVRASTTDGVNPALSEMLKGYLGSAIVNARTNDDKTLIMATRRPREIVRE
jgi:hypothetical protein